MNEWLSLNDYLTQDTKTGLMPDNHGGYVPYYQASSSCPYSKNEYVTWASSRFKITDSNVTKAEAISELKILNYFFQNGKTTICWSDGTTTTCYASPDKADAYTGFMIALAKKFMGNKNKATNLADYWINKLPARQKKAEAKRVKAEAEKKRIEEKKRQRREEYRLRIAAIQRKEAYEAAVLAHKKYGVPLNFKED